jgi:hypothetical protein
MEELLQELVQKYPYEKFRIVPGSTPKVRRKIGNNWRTICKHGILERQCIDCLKAKGNVKICIHDKIKGFCNICKAELCIHNIPQISCEFCRDSEDTCLECFRVLPIEAFRKRPRGQSKVCKKCKNDRKNEPVIYYGATSPILFSDCGICGQNLPEAEFLEPGLLGPVCKKCYIASQTCPCGLHLTVKDGLCIRCLKCKIRDCPDPVTPQSDYNYCSTCYFLLSLPPPSEEPETTTKSCKKCQRFLPFSCFSLDNAAKKRFRAVCKSCYNKNRKEKTGEYKRKIEVRRQEALLQPKCCFGCKQILPPENFTPRLDRPAGLSPRCRACTTELVLNRKKPEGSKTCSRCNQKLLVSEFSRCLLSEDGFASWCNDCLHKMEGPLCSCGMFVQTKNGLCIFCLKCQTDGCLSAVVPEYNYDFCNFCGPIQTGQII